jgi:amino acid transporter
MKNNKSPLRLLMLYAIVFFTWIMAIFLDYETIILPENRFKLFIRITGAFAFLVLLLIQINDYRNSIKNKEEENSH